MGNPNQAETAAVAARTRPWLIVSAVAICWGIFTITVLHLISSHNPTLDTLSSYAFTDRGSGMLEASVLSLAIGSFALLGALCAAGTPINRTTKTLFSSWGLGLVTAAVFPASYATHPHPVSGEIHQYSCLIAFLSMPGIGFSVLERVRETPALDGSRTMVTRLSLYSLGGLALFGTSYLLMALPRVPAVTTLSAALPVGVTQRIALATNIALLFGLLLLASRTTKLGERSN